MIFKIYTLFSFFSMSMNLYFWFISKSSSISLLMVLVYSIQMASKVSFLAYCKLPMFMIVLTLSGGLFVLISFVIMFFPGDYKSDVLEPRYMMSLIFVNFIVSLIPAVLSSEVVYDKVGSMFGGVSVWGNFVIVYVFLIILLFLFLFLINSLMNPSTGSMFSKKKKKGKKMG